MRPFKVRQVAPGNWVIENRHHNHWMYGFPSAGDAIDYCYRHWPWWL